MTLDYASFAAQMSFRVLQPDAARGSDRRFALPRPGRDDARLLELPYAPFDVFNTVLRADQRELEERLGPVLETPRMSTFGLAALINRAVARMPERAAYVNVGVWVGFSLFSGMVGNGGKQCVGIDNFSEFGGPRDAFMSRFERFKGPRHEFHELDYLDYFAKHHDERPIGVYFYDGDHAYEHQLRGLQEAEPYFTDGCIVFVDDTNWHPPYDATYDFISSSAREYEVLLDQRTGSNVHPTFWNGMIVLRAGAAKKESGKRPPPPKPAPIPRLPGYGPIPMEPEPPRVTIILHNREPDLERLEAAVEAAASQTWPALELIVVDECGIEGAATALEAVGDIAYLEPENGENDLVQRGIAASSGDFVAFASTGAPLRPTAVHVGMAFPRFSQFNGTQALVSYERLERSLELSEEINAAVPPGQAFALVSERMMVPNLVTSRKAMPFFARDGGQPLTAPASDAEAVEEVERVRSAGAGFIVFASPETGWLERYPGLGEHLRSTAHCTLESERLTVFDLRG
jgi:hypothetical protein